MGEESVQKRGVWAVLVLLMIAAVFGVLFAAGWLNNEYKRGVPDNSRNPMAVNGNK